MRTTLDIEDDLLEAVKEIATSRKTTAGQVVSALIRQSLEPQSPVAVRNGVPLLARRPAGAAKPTLALVNRLRDDPP